MLLRALVRYSVLVTINIVLFYYLVLWFRDSIRWTEFEEAILYIPAPAMLIALILGVLTLGAYGKRTALLVDKDFEPSFWIVTFGFGANNVLPFRLGDALKVYFARKNFKVSATKLIFVKVMEKSFDLSAVLIIGYIVLMAGVVAIKQTLKHFHF